MSLGYAIHVENGHCMQFMHAHGQCSHIHMDAVGHVQCPALVNAVQTEATPLFDETLFIIIFIIYYKCTD